MATELEDEITQLKVRVRQLERDVEYLMVKNAALDTRINAIGERERRLEAQRMYGIR